MNAGLEISSLNTLAAESNFNGKYAGAGIQQKFYNNTNVYRNAINLGAGECIRSKAMNCQTNIISDQQEAAQCMEIEGSSNSPTKQFINQLQGQKLQSQQQSQRQSTFTDYFTSLRFQQIQVLNKSSTNEEVYSSRIITSMINNQKNPTEFLRSHTITSDIRAKMIDWMIEVTTSYGFSDQTFFLAVSYMDSFFEKCQRQLTPQDLHLTGVTSMFIACKYEEIYPLRLQTFYEKIGHKKLAISDIKKREQEILASIDFDLSSPSILDFMSVTINKLNLEEHLLDNHLSFFRKMCIYLSKMACHEYSLNKQHNYATIAGAIIYVSFKILQQMYNEFNLVSLIQQVIQILGLNNEYILQASTIILNLARSFERQYPNLQNLKKFTADIQSINISSSTPKQLNQQLKGAN